MKVTLFVALMVASVVIIFFALHKSGMFQSFELKRRQDRLVPICESIKARLRQEKSLDYVQVHLAKPPAEILVSGFVSSSNSISSLGGILTQFRQMADITVNVRIDTNLK